MGNWNSQPRKTAGPLYFWSKALLHQLVHWKSKKQEERADIHFYNSCENKTVFPLSRVHRCKDIGTHTDHLSLASGQRLGGPGDIRCPISSSEKRILFQVADLVDKSVCGLVLVLVLVHVCICLSRLCLFVYVPCLHFTIISLMHTRVYV